MSYYLQYFTVIAHNTEKHCGFSSALPPKDTPSSGTTELEVVNPLGSKTKGDQLAMFYCTVQNMHPMYNSKS